jgi:hypothetical protein
VKRSVCISLACWPGLTHVDSARQLSTAPAEACFGPLSAEHLQLVPQSFGCLDEELCDALRTACPGSLLRLHANVQILPWRVVADLATFADQQDWFRRAARINRHLQAPAYTAHPGRRGAGTLKDVFNAARRCADWFGCPVGVEAMYPTPDDRWLLASWEEYRVLFDSGIPYALDLSHVHILSCATNRRELALLREMLACERCLEVHVSSNDGTSDQHRLCNAPPWWLPLLDDVHREAVIFSEGNHRRMEVRT